MILKEHPEIAKLLVEDKPYTIVIAVVVTAACLLNCYLSRVSPVLYRKCRCGSFC
jgi:hypothetical protein